MKAAEQLNITQPTLGSLLFGLKSMEKTKDTLEKITKSEIEKILHFSNQFCGESVKHNGAISSYKKIQF